MCLWKSKKNREKIGAVSLLKWKHVQFRSFGEKKTRPKNNNGRKIDRKIEERCPVAQCEPLFKTTVTIKVEIDIDRTNSELCVCVPINITLLSHGMMNFVCFACYSRTSLLVFHHSSVWVLWTIILYGCANSCCCCSCDYCFFVAHSAGSMCTSRCIPGVYLNLYAKSFCSTLSLAHFDVHTRWAFSHNVTAKLCTERASEHAWCSTQTILIIKIDWRNWWKITEIE